VHLERERVEQMQELLQLNTLRDQALGELQQLQKDFKLRYEWYKSTMNVESKTRQDQFDKIRVR
jgi:hypothetical protein